jgi:hypothetical protein
MKVYRGHVVLEWQLRAEVQRILLLLERVRRTRRQVRGLIALETGGSRRKTGIRSDKVGRPQNYRPGLTGPRMRGPG